MAYPDKFGLPCWEKDQAENCINIVAQVARERASVFLATHSPLKQIRNIRENSTISEEEVFQNLFSRKGELRCVVRGDVGTGKSHLIRWINLRSEYAAKNSELNLDQFKIIMIRRETGSLKSALKQMVDQLGSEFDQYIKDIKNFIEYFSEQSAREALIQEMALELNTRWELRGREPLPREHRSIGDVILSPGYRNWLKEDSGIVGKIVARFANKSSREDRENKLRFSVDDIIPPSGYLSRRSDARQVHDFVGDLTYDDPFAEKTVDLLNEALTDAQRELTGIEGSKLSEIFTAIRRDLKKEGKQLAVFIEDVTAASGGLDFDLYQAFEPREGQDICRMVAVLGMSEEGWAVLPDNEKDRVNFEFDVGENAIEWSQSSDDVANFTARYLNAIRCTDSEINTLASQRFTSDVSWSKCDKCPHSVVCHDAFGFVTFENNIKIGTFPFTSKSPSKLLNALTTERLRTSPRGLLNSVIEKAVVQSYSLFNQNKFPSDSNFPIRIITLPFWTEFESKYLGGISWSVENKNKVRFLAKYWIEAQSSDQCARELKPFIKPFNLPEFSIETRSDSLITEPLIESTTKTKDKDLEEELQAELIKWLTPIEEWYGNSKLKYDANYREYLKFLISNSIKWQDHRNIPIQYAKDVTKGKRPIKIEDQVSNVSHQQYYMEFHRDEETKNLLEALIRFKIVGKGTWEFESGELHKRRVSKWLRKNQGRIIDSLKPSPETLTGDAVKAGIQFLALSAVIRTRSRLPKKDKAKRISEIFSSVWEDTGRPVVLSDSLNKILVEIESKWDDIKMLIINELGVGQGDADYLDPIPILSILDNYEDKITLDVPPVEVSQSYWEKRFGAVSRLKEFSNLAHSIMEERKEINRTTKLIKDFLIDCDYEGTNLKEEIISCVKKICELREIQIQNLPYQNHDFEILWNSRRLQNNRTKWSNAIKIANNLNEDGNDISVLCFDPNSLIELCEDLTNVAKFLNLIEKELSDQENPGSSGPTETKDDLLEVLDSISMIIDREM
ncbi:hypothetical protein K8I28_05605 [bacterium]|nr:hypothetical protein [bacterium]